MASNIKLRIVDWNYQRNGVYNEPFWQFRVDLYGRKLLLTVVVNEEYPEVANGSCRVVDPEDLSSCWCGDQFEDSLRKNDMFIRIVRGDASIYAKQRVSGVDV